jgi:hypothetical protein
MANIVQTNQGTVTVVLEDSIHYYHSVSLQLSVFRFIEKRLNSERTVSLSVKYFKRRRLLTDKYSNNDAYSVKQ